MKRPLLERYVAPQTLLDQVWNTAPYLRARIGEQNELTLLAARPEEPGEGYLRILGRAAAGCAAWTELGEEQQLLEYFALCLACHHATVATFVPTDVDSKIRGLLWRETREPATLRTMVELVLEMERWPVEALTLRRADLGAFGPLSGHNGEWLSAAVGGYGRLTELGLEEEGQRLHERIARELWRESVGCLAKILSRGQELDALRAAMAAIHNVGDVDQGLSFWEGKIAKHPVKSVFGRLAHENAGAFGGGYLLAGRLYKELLASEGHRHYPLREVRPLRKDASLLLPFGPFLEEWGARLGTTPVLDDEERAAVLEGLVRGCQKVAGQQGYYRALHGWREANGSSFAAAERRMPAAAKKLLKESEMQKRLSVPARSFQSSYGKRVEALRAEAKRMAARLVGEWERVSEGAGIADGGSLASEMLAPYL